MMSLRTVVLALVVLVGICTALPYFRLNYDYDPVDLENGDKNVVRQFLPYIKRNIAIGRGDGLRPGK